MENTGNNIELLDRFIENQRKSRMWTILSVIIFCLLGGFVFFLSWELNKSNARYKEQNVELIKTQKELDAALADLAARNESLKGDSLSLSGQVVTAAIKTDSLQKFCDTVTALFSIQSHLMDNLGADPEARLNELSQKTFGNPNIVLSKEIKKQILTPFKWNKPVVAVYTVSIRVMPGYEKIGNALAQRLKEKNFNVSGIESVGQMTFNPTIKYFSDEDKEIAATIAVQMNSTDMDFFKNNPVNIQMLSGQAPQHQIEVWIGKYARKDFKNYILQQPKSFQKIRQ